LLELSLTRLFSVVLFYHFAFLAISIALLGLGAGGVFAFVRRPSLNRRPTSVIASASCLAGSALVVLALYVVLHSQITLELSRANFLKLTLLYLSCAVPFFCCGVVLSVVFARSAGSIPRLYGADLAGGAVACLLTVPALNWLGAPNAILVAALVLAVTAGLWSETAALRNMSALLSTILAALLIYNSHGSLFDIVYAKGVYRDKGWIEFTRWNAISRVEVVNNGGFRSIVIDADASTYIPSVDPEHFHGTEWEQHVTSAGPLLVNALRPRGDFCIIGPGGGEDILRAVANGSKNVSAAEINPTIVNEIMRDRFAAVSFHLYDRPEVHVHVSDGRSFVRQSRDSYDVVQMTLVDTWASTAAGAFALSENNLYTVQAFREYFDHLKPDGILAITRWEFKSPREALRLVANEIAVLQQIGATNVARHFIVVSDGPLDEDGRPVLVLVKKRPFTPEEEQTTLRHLEQFKTLSLIYSPSDRTRPAGVHPTDPSRPWNPFAALIESQDPVGFARDYEYNVSPVTDDKPFFFFTLKLRHLLSHSPLEKGLDWKVNLGVLVLFILLGISVLAVLAFLILPLLFHAPARGAPPWPLLYFVVIGLGYILVEITLIQRFVLFLGHPVYALTVVIFLMLLSSGIGSLASRKWLRDARRILPVTLIIAALALVYLVTLPAFLPRLVGITFASKLLISAVLLVPLGLIMGMPFPTGLRQMAANRTSFEPHNENSASRIEWAWALNAASSVLGSVIAMFIAIEYGLSATLFSAVVCYLLAALLSRTLSKRAAAR
jgi:predicted membrane-bound spermidine synthase